MKHAASRGAVRIIAGRWRRRRLPVAASGEIRPTPDRVRETLFNWLGTGVEGTRCLDLFAGTGALGFEAASRGAKAVVLVERDRDVAAALEFAVRTLGADNVTIERADALQWAPPADMRFDIVFLDPPWFGPAPEEALARLEDADALVPGCVAYLETERDPADIKLPPGWRLLRTRRAGRVRYHLASRNDQPAGRRRAAHGDD
ncbi:MAG: 16S rRNA (guanine(966)-N(2))-methyltransferase RsmD [Thiotrichales bacterium]|nr:16S rRNA (guanine(966)-N(2))-methyltransferase RsmD [Thiotrichales bacterium]